MACKIIGGPIQINLILNDKVLDYPRIFLQPNFLFFLDVDHRFIVICRYTFIQAILSHLEIIWMDAMIVGYLKSWKSIPFVQNLNQY